MQLLLIWLASPWSTRQLSYTQMVKGKPLAARVLKIGKQVYQSNSF